MNLEDAVDQVDDPVVPDARARVEARLEDSIGAQAVMSDLDHQDWGRRMLDRIIPRRAVNDRDIGFGLGLCVERDWKLYTHRPSGPESSPQRLGRELGCHGVWRALRLPYDQAAREQLDGLVLVEDA